MVSDELLLVCIQVITKFGKTATERQDLPEVDLAILHHVKKTNCRSHRLNGKLKGLKQQVYDLQDDIRHL